METEFQNAVGKGIGEVVRDIADFLSTPFIINEERQLDLCTLVPDLNMHEQFSFALLSEAHTQGWDVETAENFYRHACGKVIDPETVSAMIFAFRDRTSREYRAYAQKYSNRFTALDGSYWATVLALGIDAGQIGEVMQYLRLFTVCLMEFAYMEDRNPDATYTWCYYDSFRQMLDDLTAEPDPEPLPLKVRALGGSAGKREQDTYYLSLGVDIENPNLDRLARGIQLDIVLKDKDGKVITTIGDKLESLDPGAIYHYGVTRKIRGNAVASFSATAKAAAHLKLQTPIMKHVSLSELRLRKNGEGMHFSGNMTGKYDVPLRSMTLHYQFLSAQNKILGGGSEWVLDGLEPGSTRQVNSKIALPIDGAAKVVYSIDFDVVQLLEE
ncbi:MAG: hypothetical protein IJD75_08395 [Clostridia bacterium]|nr:hypothetical protein [Clostridia bacterium]